MQSFFLVGLMTTSAVGLQCANTPKKKEFKVNYTGQGAAPGFAVDNCCQQCECIGCPVPSCSVGTVCEGACCLFMAPCCVDTECGCKTQNTNCCICHCAKSCKSDDGCPSACAYNIQLCDRECHCLRNVSGGGNSKAECKIDSAICCPCLYPCCWAAGKVCTLPCCSGPKCRWAQTCVCWECCLSPLSVLSLCLCRAGCCISGEEASDYYGLLQQMADQFRNSALGMKEVVDGVQEAQQGNPDKAVGHMTKAAGHLDNVMNSMEQSMERN